VALGATTGADAVEVGIGTGVDVAGGLVGGGGLVGDGGLVGGRGVFVAGGTVASCEGVGEGTVWRSGL